MAKILLVLLLFISSCVIPESCCEQDRSTYYPNTYYQPTKVVIIKKDKPMAMEQKKKSPQYASDEGIWRGLIKTLVHHQVEKQYVSDEQIDDLMNPKKPRLDKKGKEMSIQRRYGLNPQGYNDAERRFMYDFFKNKFKKIFNKFFSIFFCHYNSIHLFEKNITTRFNITI